MTRTVGIYVYDEVEVLDFAGPFEVFSTASRVYGRQNPAAETLFEVRLIAARTGPVSARAGLRVKPDFTIDDCPRLDLLIVPGGVHVAELDRPAVIRWIESASLSAEITASVCTGAFLLAKAGLLDGLAATTHWEDLADLRQSFPGVDVRENRRWIDAGAILTSAGISAGIDMSLHLVARLLGSDLARRTARQMDYRWLEHPGGD
ncbi:MAG: DJ-1/PfpI family protein [Gammaproteobacteria bacterium]|nr:DJ-1/PfpI family protein [Gammaproteobacteria bacterium]MDH4256104.1 DJ-1/PfpI family protein [Gammaproteobacteria bacterium]MDH5309122.1 DJ-1/PfpI family protein [Gammaproteobacteria bacterium]